MDEIASDISFHNELTGRDKEFERLRELWGEVRKNKGSTVFVSGEADKGKTRMVTDSSTWT